MREIWLVTAPGFNLRGIMNREREAPEAIAAFSDTVPDVSDARWAETFKTQEVLKLEPVFPDEQLQPLERQALGVERFPLDDRCDPLQAVLEEAWFYHASMPDERDAEIKRDLARVRSDDAASRLAVVDRFRPYISTFYPYFRVRVIHRAGRDPVAGLRSLPGVAAAYDAPSLSQDAFMPSDALFGDNYLALALKVFAPDWMPRLRKQWNLFLIDVPGAWAFTTGEGATVAVIDSGVENKHPEFKGRLHPESDRSLLYEPRPGSQKKDAHGTLVAGIIAANTGKDGVVGIAPKATVLSRVQGGRQPLTAAIAENIGLSDWIAAINVSATLGAKIINCSWHVEPDCCAEEDPFSGEHPLTEAILYATRMGSLVVCSAGNRSNYGQRTPYESWPGALDGRTYKGESLVVVSVGGVDVRAERFPSSNYGPWLTLVAPGYEVPSTDLWGREGWNDGRFDNGDIDNFDNYAPFWGTSAAVAHVSGVAALMVSACPTLTPRQIQTVLTRTATPLTPRAETGHGLVDAARAVRLAAVSCALQRIARAFPTFNSRDEQMIRQLRDLIVGTDKGRAHVAPVLFRVAGALSAALNDQPDRAQALMRAFRGLYDHIDIACGHAKDQDGIPLGRELVLAHRGGYAAVTRFQRALETLLPDARGWRRELFDFLLRKIVNEKRRVVLDALGADDSFRRRQWEPSILDF
ncbi:MAG: S8 family serine peptidase [Myxococcota bacterium]